MGPRGEVGVLPAILRLLRTWSGGLDLLSVGGLPTAPGGRGGGRPGLRLAGLQPAASGVAEVPALWAEAMEATGVGAPLARAAGQPLGLSEGRALEQAEFLRRMNGQGVEPGSRPEQKV